MGKTPRFFCRFGQEKLYLRVDAPQVIRSPFFERHIQLPADAEKELLLFAHVYNVPVFRIGVAWLSETRATSMLLTIAARRSSSN